MSTVCGFDSDLKWFITEYDSNTNKYIEVADLKSASPYSAGYEADTRYRKNFIIYSENKNYDFNAITLSMGYNHTSNQCSSYGNGIEIYSSEFYKYNEKTYWKKVFDSDVSFNYATTINTNIKNAKAILIKFKSLTSAGHSMGTGLLTTFVSMSINKNESVKTSIGFHKLESLPDVSLGKEGHFYYIKKENYDSTISYDSYLFVEGQFTKISGGGDLVVNPSLATEKNIISYDPNTKQAKIVSSKEMNLEDLGNVNIKGIKDGYFLSWNENLQKFIPFELNLQKEENIFINKNENKIYVAIEGQTDFRLDFLFTENTLQVFKNGSLQILNEDYNVNDNIVEFINPLKSGDKVTFFTNSAELIKNHNANFTISYEYDEQNRVIKEIFDGEVQKIVEYEYNSEGRITNKKVTKDGNVYEASYEYDSDGNLIKEINNGANSDFITISNVVKEDDSIEIGSTLINQITKVNVTSGEIITIEDYGYKNIKPEFLYLSTSESEKENILKECDISIINELDYNKNLVLIDEDKISLLKNKDLVGTKIEVVDNNGYFNFNIPKIKEIESFNLEGVSNKFLIKDGDSIYRINISNEEPTLELVSGDLTNETFNTYGNDADELEYLVATTKEIYYDVENVTDPEGNSYEKINVDASQLDTIEDILIQ